MVKHIEEDFRFATAIQVQHYTPAELLRKPHMSGYDLTQLLDQIDEEIRKTHAAGHTFQAFLRAPGGTALCIAEHVKAVDRLNELVISVEAEHCDDMVMGDLLDMSHVLDAITDPDVFECLERGYSYSTWYNILACSEDVVSWFNATQQHEWFKNKSCLIYDPERKLADIKQEHTYFMGSAILRVT